VWTDLQHTDSLKVVTVEPFSPAYFELLRQLPELKPVVQRFDKVLVAGREVSIEFAPGGLTSAAAVTRLVAQFRAS
jgi:hypothetical protein